MRNNIEVISLFVDIKREDVKNNRKNCDNFIKKLI